MARKAKALPMSKSEAIRSCRNENPDMGPKQIAATLNDQGYKVTPQFVSTVLSNDKRKSGNAGGRRNRELSISDLQVAKELVTKLGGIDNAQSALKAYSDLIAK